MLTPKTLLLKNGPVLYSELALVNSHLKLTVRHILSQGKLCPYSPPRVLLATSVTAHLLKVLQRDKATEIFVQRFEIHNL